LETHPDRLADYLPVLRDETGRLARLVDDLFALARLDAGELELHLVPVDLKPLLGKIVAGCAPLAWESRRVVVEADLPDDPSTGSGQALPPVLADSQRVEQILDNLLTNALRHTPEGGVITVAARPAPGEVPGTSEVPGTWVEIRVTDTGIGIAPEDLPHVFERFYRADPARSGGGAGLGLAIVKGLVEAQGGQVGVESTPGQGASFWFTLPRADEFTIL
jgi:signal transduction histidine kinase